MLWYIISKCPFLVHKLPFNLTLNICIDEEVIFWPFNFNSGIFYYRDNLKYGIAEYISNFLPIQSNNFLH